MLPCRMRAWHAKLGLVIGSAVLICAPATDAGEADPTAAALGLIESRCLECHNPEKKKSRLDLSTRELALEGGNRGPALVPGDAEKSRIYRLVEAGEMPEGNPLPLRYAEMLRDWIEAGAPWERALKAPPPRPRADRSFWSLQPLSDAAPPAAGATADGPASSTASRRILSSRPRTSRRS